MLICIAAAVAIDAKSEVAPVVAPCKGTLLVLAELAHFELGNIV